MNYLDECFAKGFRDGMEKKGLSLDSVLNNLKQDKFRRYNIPFLGTSLGGIIGHLAANPGQGTAGFGYGALKGLGTALGASLGSGSIENAQDIFGDSAPILGLGSGGALGYLGSEAVLDELYGKERKQEIFGNTEPEIQGQWSHRPR